MKKLSSLFLVLAVWAIAVASVASAPVKIDIAYLNHGPLQPTLRELRALLPEYGDRVSVHWFDFDSEEGNRFKAEMGITRHVPMVIYINGSTTVQIDGRTVTFSGFPTGSGPAFFQGKWKVDDLKTALDRMTNGN